MVEEPMKSSAPLGGRLALSFASKFAMSFSQRSKFRTPDLDRVLNELR
jgi:hypothetical protein